MRPAKLHELGLPSKYMVWRKYIHGTKLQSFIGPERFTSLLETRRAVEFVDWKGFTKCKVLNEKIIQEVIEELNLKPYSGLFSGYASRLAQVFKSNR